MGSVKATEPRKSGTAIKIAFNAVILRLLSIIYFRGCPLHWLENTKMKKEHQ